MVPNPANTPTFARFALGSSLILCNKVHIVSMKYMVGLLYYIWPSAISIVVGKLQDAACVVVANGGDHLLFHLLWSTWEAPFSHPARLSLALRVYFWRKLGSGTVGRWWWWGWDMITYIVWWYTTQSKHLAPSLHPTKIYTLTQPGNPWYYEENPRGIHERSSSHFA